jgi:hypothetical protein
MCHGRQNPAPPGDEEVASAAVAQLERNGLQISQ